MDHDKLDIGLLSVAAIAGLLALFGFVTPSADLVQPIFEAAEQAAPYNSPIEAGLALIAVLSGGGAYFRRKLV